MQVLPNTLNKVVVVFDPRQEKPVRSFPREIRTKVRFSEALARSQAEGDVISSLCAIAKLPVSYTAIQRTWPWLTERVEPPCGCKVTHPSVLMTLCHIYDRHVVDAGDWSMPQLVEWATRMQTQLL
jgi:hypothetical protein